MQDQPRVLSEISSWYAFTVVAATDRFKAFDIFATPIFLRASDFSSRTSDAVHRRRTVFFVFANFGSFVCEPGLLAYQSVLTTPFQRLTPFQDFQ